MHRSDHNKKGGFTLIEMMVATTLFIIVSLVITGALMMVVQSYRKVQSVKLAIDNLTFSMDNMILRLRDGTDYRDVDIALAGNRMGISFINVNNQRISFLYNTVNPKDGYLEKCEGDNTAGEPLTACVRLTSPEVNLTKLTFLIKQNSCIDLLVKRPLVIIFAQGEAGSARGRTAFAFQTTVSQRNARPTSAACP